MCFVASWGSCQEVWLWGNGCDLGIAEFGALVFILLVHQHLNTCTERIHLPYKALHCGKAFQVNFKLKILVFHVNTKLTTKFLSFKKTEGTIYFRVDRFWADFLVGKLLTYFQGLVYHLNTLLLGLASSGLACLLRSTPPKIMESN